MGADIYLYAEKWNGSQWFFASGNPKGELENQPAVIDSSGALATVNVGRNADLFALLGRMANESDVTPLCFPIDLPEDVCEEIEQEFLRFGDAYFPSWILAKELLNYDWNQVVQKQGFVGSQVATLFQNNPMGFPVKQWSKDILITYASYMQDGVLVK